MKPGESRLFARHGARRVRVQRAGFRDRGFEKTFFLIEEMTEELRLSEKAAYEKLIRMMSHEVNNSVAAVRSLLESLLRYAPDVRENDREDFTTAVDVASRRIDALGKFVSGFAEVVRIPPPHRTPARIGEIVTRLVALMRPEADARGVRLSMSVDGDGPVSVDAAQIEQAVLNIVRNAIEAAGENGLVAIDLRDNTLTVCDTGPGIADISRSQLFTPFFTTKRDGRGIGLTVVQEILTSHGFAFSLENRPSGGAIFTVQFAPVQ
jgi:signal transduction histidine kinase